MSFGTNELDSRMFREQIWISILVIFPSSILLGHISIRLFAKNKIRSDILTSLGSIVIADLLLGWFAGQSFQCIPFEEDDDWKELVLQSLGIGCPLYARPLSPHSTMSIYTMRFLAICVGLFLGESFCPIALTGGIASGKSTVADQLFHGPYQDLMNDGESSDTKATQTTDKVDEAKSEKKTAGDTKDDTPQKEGGRHRRNIEDGTFYLVDTDNIAHSLYDLTAPSNIYNQIIQEFGQDIVDPSDNSIDRKKLGAKIFSDRNLRRKLNKMTHPRIIFQMLKQMVWGLYFSSRSLCLVDIPLFYEASAFLRCLFCIVICVSCDGTDQQLERLRKRNPDLSEEQCRQRIAAQLPLEQKAKRSDLVITNSGDLQFLAVQVEKVRLECMNRIYGGIGLRLYPTMMVFGMAFQCITFYKLFSEHSAGGDGTGMGSDSVGDEPFVDDDQF